MKKIRRILNPENKIKVQVLKMTYDTYLKYQSDEDFMRSIYQEKSSYYVRCKGWRDGENKNINPPAKKGYFFEEYMRSRSIAMYGLPF